MSRSKEDYLRMLVKITGVSLVLAGACLATGCGGGIYLDDRHGDVGVCIGFSVGDEDGEEVSQ